MSASKNKHMSLSASSLSKMVTKQATRVQTAKTTSGTSKLTLTSNPEPNTLSDQYNVTS